MVMRERVGRGASMPQQELVASAAEGEGRMDQ
jgi:hypothetical protein